MSRGLGPLQQWILQHASQKRRLYYVEIMVGYFGWRPKWPLRYHEPGETDRLSQEWVGTLRLPGLQHFSRREIGERRYRSAMAAVSRACRRLAERGLVTWIGGAHSHWSGVEITEAGRRWVSVNLTKRFPQS